MDIVTRCTLSHRDWFSHFLKGKNWESKRVEV